MPIRTFSHPEIRTRAESGEENGFLVPIYNVHDGVFQEGDEPKQVYLTVLYGRARKGPHLHFIRTGFFTCIRGNVRVVLKTANGYETYESGQDHKYLSVEVPRGTPALLINDSADPAYVLNMPQPAWTPEMNDEHGADFSDYRG